MPTQVPQNSAVTRIACILVFVLSVIALAYPPMPVLTLFADSEQYRQMSEALFSGHLFPTTGALSEDPHVATPLRPPLFPLLLGIASRIPGINPNTALITLHIILGAFVLTGTRRLLAENIHPLLSTTACGIALYSAKQAAWGILSEWLAMTSLFVACISYLAWGSRTSLRLALVVSLFLSLSTLTRAALIPWLMILPFMLLQAPRGKTRATATVLAMGIFPLVLWGSMNLLRSGSFSLSPYEGLNLVATARSLGPIPVDSHDPESTRRLIAILNEQGVTPSDGAFSAPEVHRWNGEFYEAFHTNFNVTSNAIRTLGENSTTRPSELATRALLAHSERYRRFLRGGVHTILTQYLPLIVACIVSSVWLTRRAQQYARWSLGVATVCVVSLTYLILIFGTMLWLHRYFIPVQPILLFCLTVSSVRLVGAMFGKKSTTANSKTR
jgi:hypothetical protein